MIDAVVQYFSGTFGKLELVATILLIINVWLLAKQKIINFWFGAVGVAIYGYIFLEFKLYSDMLLQWAYFLPTQILGWYWWKTLGTGDDNLSVNKLDFVDRTSVVILIGLSALVLGYCMERWTDASFPYWDALTTVMSVVANYLLLRKIWENWVIWVMMDVIAINIYYLKGLYVTSGLYVIFLFLATYGLMKWWNDYNNQTNKVKISGISSRNTI